MVYLLQGVNSLKVSDFAFKLLVLGGFSFTSLIGLHADNLIGL